MTNIINKYQGNLLFASQTNGKLDDKDDGKLYSFANPDGLGNRGLDNEQ